MKQEYVILRSYYPVHGKLPEISEYLMSTTVVLFLKSELKSEIAKNLVQINIKHFIELFIQLFIDSYEYYYCGLNAFLYI